MSDAKQGPSGFLDPVDRSMEALFGLIMVLTFTGSLSVLSAGRQDVREMLVGAVGCNLAWGVIDACFFLMGILAERGRGRQLAARLQTSTRAEDVSAILSEVMPEVLVDLMSPLERENLRARIALSSTGHRPPLLNWRDLVAAGGVFFWVFLVTFPVALPFLFIQDAPLALRVSNVIAIVLLGAIGWRLAQFAGFSKWITILSMVVFGILMVAITIALGG